MTVYFIDKKGVPRDLFSRKAISFPCRQGGEDKVKNALPTSEELRLLTQETSRRTKITLGYPEL